jgi:hypothetical protein
MYNVSSSCFLPDIFHVANYLFSGVLKMSSNEIHKLNILFETLGFHGMDSEECSHLQCYAMWFL